MSFNGSGTFNINTAGQPVVTGTVITSSAFNALTADLATGLSTCITKDGQTTVTANIPMNSFKFTGLAAGTAATDSVRLSQLQAGGATLVTVTGTNTYVGTMSPALSAYAAGNTFTFLVPNTNTTSCTLNIDGLGAKAITRDGTTALVAGDLVANSEVAVVYDGTQFQVLNSNSKTNFNLSGNFTIAGSVTPSGGTANGVAYLNGSKVLTTGSALTFDGTNFATTGTASATKLIPTGGTATGNGMYLPAANTLAWSNNGAETMRLDSSGNLGLGVTPSAWGSPFKAMDLPGSAFAAESTIATHVTQNSYYNGTNWIYKSTAAASRALQFSGQHIWYNAASGSSGTAITWTQAMTLDASGNLLVGTTSVFSASKLTVQGNGTYAASILGTAGNTTSNALFIGLGGNRSADTTYSVINYADTDGTGTARFRVYGNGNVVNTNNSYGAISDLKLKENISDVSPKLDKLCNVRIVNYNLIADESKEKRIGVIAQELEQVFPSLVDNTADLDEEGNPTGTTTKSVKYSVFVPMLIKAMQEQQQMIQDLRARVAALESK